MFVSFIVLYFDTRWGQWATVHRSHITLGEETTGADIGGSCLCRRASVYPHYDCRTAGTLSSVTTVCSGVRVQIKCVLKYVVHIVTTAI